MIILIAIRPLTGQAAPERVVVGPYHDEPSMQKDMAIAEQAGFTTSAFEVEAPEVFRSTLGMPL